MRAGAGDGRGHRLAKALPLGLAEVRAMPFALYLEPDDVVPEESETASVDGVGPIVQMNGDYSIGRPSTTIAEGRLPLRRKPTLCGYDELTAPTLW